MAYRLILVFAILWKYVSPISAAAETPLVTVHNIGSQLYWVVTSHAVTVKVIDSTQDFVREVFPLTPTKADNIKKGLERIPADYLGYAFIDAQVMDGFSVVLQIPDRSAGPAQSILVANIFVPELEAFFAALDDVLPRESRFKIGYAEGMKQVESISHHPSVLTRMKMEDYVRMNDASDLPRAPSQSGRPIGFVVNPKFPGGESVLTAARRAFPECAYIGLTDFWSGSDAHYDYVVFFAGREIKSGFESVYWRYLVFAKRKTEHDWSAARVFDLPDNHAGSFDGPIELLEKNGKELGMKR